MKSRSRKLMSGKSYKSSQLYLERILEHIQKIQKYKLNLSFETFKKRDQDYDAICMQLSQIGENVAKIERASDRIIESFPSTINWKSLKGLRNRIDHDYTWLEVERVWEVLEDNLTNLESGAKYILRKRYGVEL